MAEKLDSAGLSAKWIALNEKFIYAANDLLEELVKSGGSG